MTTVRDKEWLQEFGIEEDSSNFYDNRTDFTSKEKFVPQAHVVRRAFELLDLDGVLCDQGIPLVYFKQMERIEPQEVMKLHRLFWNHGGAPLLVIVSKDDVQIYSGFARPTNRLNSKEFPSGYVDTLKRASTEMRSFLPTVETGEFFYKHARSFDPSQRVDRDLLNNLEATRKKLVEVSSDEKIVKVLDFFLCRLVFTCYLFDRKIIGNNYLAQLGFPTLNDLQEVLAQSSGSKAKATLYRLFQQLAHDFNGDLFSDDLEAEAALLSEAHLGLVDSFFQGTDVINHQAKFWPYDFGVIPIETISAIYERFLQTEDKKQGAFYTPRFLAEMVLDIALKDRPSLLNIRILDPACGSGIFLVGVFNRMAEEWRQANPDADDELRSSELRKILLSNLYGVDKSVTACRITAFSLYLAYLDQLLPRDIQKLQAQGGFLPRLVTPNGGIWCSDFFEENASYPTGVDLVIGNPPWGDLAKKGTPAANWCARRKLPVPDKQIATAFIWKAAENVSESGHVCFVLPHGILFHHSDSALSFQKSFIKQHSLEYVLNLADFQRFLFNKAEHPALVIKYRKVLPNKDHSIDYWIPKVDWKAIKAEIITIPESDRKRITVKSILANLEGKDAPQIWKRKMWATPRDQRLLERLFDMPRLRDRVRKPREKAPHKPWLMAEGFQPCGANENPARCKPLNLPSNLFVEVTSPHLNLFLLESDCTENPFERNEKSEDKRSYQVWVRNKSNSNIEIYRGPHVLVTKGFQNVAYADFSVSFRHALRGITGSPGDRKLLMFLAAYLRSSLAQYIMFHTSSNWGVSRHEVHVEELLRLPFPLPSALPDAARAEQIVARVSRLVESATKEAKEAADFFLDRNALVQETQNLVEPLIYEYFDVLPSERVLVEDTIEITSPSFRPGPGALRIPTLDPVTPEIREKYKVRLCETLNEWAGNDKDQVFASTVAFPETGVGLAILETGDRGDSGNPVADNSDLFAILEQIRAAATVKTNTLELLRGVKYFQGNRLFIVKPLQRRYWTETAALNDADEIAYSILMDPSGENR